MKRVFLSFGLLMACLLAAPVGAKPVAVTDPSLPRSLPADGPVSVQWTDPAQFSDILYSGNRQAAAQGSWVQQLAKYLRTAAAKQLQPGQTLEVTITDIKRAGQYEPGRIRLQDVRVIREIYPPRIDLNFKWLDAQGNVISEGERKLNDTAFMMNSMSFNSNDSLRFEKNLIDSWIRQEFKPRAGN